MYGFTVLITPRPRFSHNNIKEKRKTYRKEKDTASLDVFLIQSNKKSTTLNSNKNMWTFPV